MRGSPSRHIPTNQEHGREGLCLLNSLQVFIHMRIVARQKREPGGAQHILRRMFDKLRAAKALDERIGFPVGAQKGKIFERGLEIRAFLFFAPLEFWLAHGLPASSYAFAQDGSLALLTIRRHLHVCGLWRAHEIIHRSRFRVGRLRTRFEPDGAADWSEPGRNKSSRALTGRWSRELSACPRRCVSRASRREHCARRKSVRAQRR